MAFFNSRRFNFTLLIGGLASVVDWVSLVLMVRYFHLSPQTANVPSLFIGSLIQFLGNRHVVFNSTERNAARQATEFFTVEVIAFFLNSLLFYALVTYTPINYALARPLGGFIVFFGYSYPLFKFVFRKAPATASASANTNRGKLEP